MPAIARVEAFIAMVESGQHAEAIEDFYHPEASMQENLGPPRQGRDALVARERKMLEGVAEVRSHKVGPVFVSGDTVVINWVFDFVMRSGRSFTLDEVAWQIWRDDRILRERFYYDPGQTRSTQQSQA
ncbi:MAG: nuclear transport factor 2 family protein [Burkholderiales bacterium]